MKFMDPLVIPGERCKWVCGRCGCMRVKYPGGQSCSTQASKNVVEAEGQSMNMEKDYLRYLGKYCRVTWKGGAVSGVVERIEEGLLFVDIGYGVSVQCITKIEEANREQRFRAYFSH
jgi:hypothetical protein